MDNVENNQSKYSKYRNAYIANNYKWRENHKVEYNQTQRVYSLNYYNSNKDRINAKRRYLTMIKNEIDDMMNILIE